MPNQSTAILEQFSRITDHWSPKVIGRVNDQYLKVAKVQGTFAWHKHDGEDELFLVMKGELRIELENSDPVRLREGEFYVVPRGVMHNPVAEEECWILLIETVTTQHTGDTITPLTRSVEEQLA
ncbi:MAG TPA: cupin domain-containing protein [Thermoanaerobaculia bacterium]|jgi:quercetin dioxygenase-like cupin family protein